MPFSIKWIYLIERRNFDQKNKFSNKNDMVCAWSNFRKKSYGIFIYDKWNFKLQILSIVHFDRVIAGQMAHISGVKWTIFETIHKKMSERLIFLIFFECHTISWKMQFLVKINFGTVPSGLQLNLLQMNCFKIEKYSSNLREKFFPSLLLAKFGKMISKEVVICTNSQAFKRYISTHTAYR